MKTLQNVQEGIAQYKAEHDEIEQEIDVMFFFKKIFVEQRLINIFQVFCFLKKCF